MKGFAQLSWARPGAPRSQYLDGSREFTLGALRVGRGRDAPSRQPFVSGVVRLTAERRREGPPGTVIAFIPPGESTVLKHLAEDHGSSLRLPRFDVTGRGAQEQCALVEIGPELGPVVAISDVKRSLGFVEFLLDDPYGVTEHRQAARFLLDDFSANLR